MGLLNDDKEYIDGITEASFWGSAIYLRKLFAMLLMSGSISRPEYVLNKQRSLLQMPGNIYSPSLINIIYLKCKLIVL